MIKTQEDLNKVMARAIHDKDRINSSPYKYARLDVEFFTYEIIIRLTSGVVLSDGEKERATATRYYHMSDNGKVMCINYAHN